MRRIEIDLNRRFGLLTPARYVGTAPQVGETVAAYEPEDAVVANAVVTRVNKERSTVYLDVDWTSLSDDTFTEAPSPEEFTRMLRQLRGRRPTFHSAGDQNLVGL